MLMLILGYELEKTGIKGWDARKKSSIFGEKEKSMTIFMLILRFVGKKSSIL